MYLDYLTVVLCRWLSQRLTTVKPENGHTPRDLLRPGRACSCFWDADPLGSSRPLAAMRAAPRATSTRNEGIYSDHNGEPRRVPSVAFR